MDKDTGIIINQTLHGYNNGHTLIASSIELISEVKRIMLPISDMSGNSMLNGFEEYITGYPLKDINTYALAKTWYAPEMKRPGCVWTHTLLINFADLPLINNINSLLSLFQRPFDIDDTSYYYNTLSWPSFLADITDDSLAYDFTSNFVKSVILKLYEQSGNAIFIKGLDSLAYDNLILAIWLQQWPRLKRNFSFCTGAISPRTFNNQLLDLQVVPFRIDSFFSQEQSNIIIDTREKLEYIITDWVEIAYNDLLYPSDLRKYFRQFGADVAASRISFRQLLTLFVYFKNRPILLPDCIFRLSEVFPSVKDANNLKVAVLDKHDLTFDYLIPTFDEAETLFQLSVTSYHSAFDYSKVRFKERFIDFFTINFEKAIPILNSIIQQEPNPFGEEMIKIIAERLEQSNPNKSTWSFKNLVLVLINLNPRLTYRTDFWKHNLNNQVEIIHSLQRNSAYLAIDWQAIVTILIELNSSIDPNIFDEINLDVEKYILNWIDRRKEIKLGKNWFNYLRRKPEKILNWLSENVFPNYSVLKIVVPLLNPNSKLVVDNGIQPWLNLIINKNDEYEFDFATDLKAFSLALAFNINSSKALKLFEHSFESIYNIIAKDKLPYDGCWEYLEIHTKPLSIFKDWDKCKKLVNALVDHLIKNDLPVHNITSIIQSQELRTRIQTQYKKRK